MIIEGVASSCAVDDRGEVLLPRGVQFELPLPLTFGPQHRSPLAIGYVTRAHVTDERITFRAIISSRSSIPRLQKILDQVRAGIEDGSLAAVSVGWRGGTITWDRTGPHPVATSWPWRELLLTRRGANPDAIITWHGDTARDDALLPPPERLSLPPAPRTDAAELARLRDDLREVSTRPPADVQLPDGLLTVAGDGTRELTVEGAAQLDLSQPGRAIIRTWGGGAMMVRKGSGDSGTRYLVQTESDRAWTDAEFVRGQNIIGVRHAGASVRLPSNLAAEKIIHVKDEVGGGATVIPYQP